MIALKTARTPAALAGHIAAALRSGNTAEAEQLLRKRLLNAPDDPDALVALANIVLGRDHVDEGMHLLQRALVLVPQAQEVRFRLAALHHRKGYFPAALALIEDIKGPLAEQFETLALKATLLGQVGRREDEIAIYERLIAVSPSVPRLHLALGTALNYAGRSAEAIAALRKAIALQPTFGEAWWALANLKSFRFSDDEVTAMQTSLRGALGTEDSLHFHFALGRAFEQREEFESSFDHYLAGNRLRAAKLPAVDSSVTRLVDQSIKTFTAKLFKHYAGAGCDTREPIFIVGLQRSGSTLIEQILASHPAIEGTGELVTMQSLWEELSRRAQGRKRSPFAFLRELPPGHFKEIGEQYLQRTRRYRQLGRPMFIDKLPANWLHLGLIRLALPNAKIIDARRHPLACGLSNFKQHYASGVTFSYSLSSIGRFYRDYLRMMTHFDTVQPGAVLHVLNEALVDNPEEQVRRMLAYLELDYDPACLEFHKSKRAVQTPSAEQVRRPINRDGVDAWRSYDLWLAPLREELGPALEQWDCIA